MLSIAYCETEINKQKTKIEQLQVWEFFFFFEFAKNEGRSDPCPNTLIWSGLIIIITTIIIIITTIMVRFSSSSSGSCLQLSYLSNFLHLRDTALSSMCELFQGWPTTVYF